MEELTFGNIFEYGNKQYLIVKSVKYSFNGLERLNTPMLVDTENYTIVPEILGSRIIKEVSNLRITTESVVDYCAYQSPII